MTAAMTTSTSTPATDLLVLLQQYSSLHTAASADLKSSIWNITKARRGRSYQGGGTGGFGGVEYSVEDVREELRAQAVLECKEEGDEPGLVNEDSSEDVGVKEDSGGSSGGFVLHLDGMKAVHERGEKERRSHVEQLDVITANKENEGLRRRRGHADDADKSAPTKTTMEESNSTIVDEEERLRNADPLNLFGVPPPALRVAQAKSRSAVAFYVEVANLAREIVRIINQDR